MVVRDRAQKSQQRMLRNKSELMSIADNLNDLVGGGSTAAHANVAWHNAEALDILKNRQSAEMGAFRDMLSERNHALDRRLAQRRSAAPRLTA